ncbi:MAG: Arc family DNA binding domain-containing protein [Verrucomicrobia bacterium]|nr:Arc family DNA binding domain-containing protein [Verrucomicrobiota bacterium]
MDSRKSFLLRIDPELWKELEKWAADELRSINAQIEYLLKQAVLRRKKSQQESENEPSS